MNDASRLPDEVAEDLLSGGLAEGDAQRLRQGAGAARDFAGALLVHGLLAGREADPEKALAAIRHRLGKRSPARRWLLWTAAVAAALLIAIAGSLLLPPWRTMAPSGAHVVSGTLEGIEPGSAEVPLGRAIGTGREHVVLACREGSRLDVAPESSLTLRGKAGRDRWRIELAAGGVQCDVPNGQDPFRVCTRAGDVVTEGTRFSVRLAEGYKGLWGLAVSVAEGRVRVERRPQPNVGVAAGGLRLFPAPTASRQEALLALRLLFPGEAVEYLATKSVGGLLEIEGWIGDQDVEAVVAPDGSVQSYSRELPRGELPGALPAPVREALRARFGPDAQWVEAEVEFRGGTVAYEVTLRVQGKEVEAKLDADGRFLGREENE
ncbi:MAG: hypothetical protein FJ290_32900 [Planctomycetes bacterium]|nr:hypothetical protein [Planctomycetota bacterium]